MNLDTLFYKMRSVSRGSGLRWNVTSPRVCFGQGGRPSAGRELSGPWTRLARGVGAAPLGLEAGKGGNSRPVLGEA